MDTTEDILLNSGVPNNSLKHLLDRHDDGEDDEQNYNLLLISLILG